MINVEDVCCTGELVTKSIGYIVLATYALTLECFTNTVNKLERTVYELQYYCNSYDIQKPCVMKKIVKQNNMQRVQILN